MSAGGGYGSAAGVGMSANLAGGSGCGLGANGNGSGAGNCGNGSMCGGGDYSTGDSKASKYSNEVSAELEKTSIKFMKSNIAIFSFF